MTDELVKRLRNPTYYTHPTTEDGRLAADRIEQLERELSISRMAQVVMDNGAEALTAERDKYESAWMTAEGKLADVEAERDRLREALDGLLTLVEHANFEEGWCCCGDDMLHHQSPMDCGHTPVDMGEYHASLAIKEARAALKGDSQ